MYRSHQDVEMTLSSVIARYALKALPPLMLIVLPLFVWIGLSGLSFVFEDDDPGEPRHPALPSCTELGADAIGEAFGTGSAVESDGSDNSVLCSTDNGSVSVLVMPPAMPREPKFPPFEGVPGASGGILGDWLIIRMEPFLIQVHGPAGGNKALNAALDVVVNKLPQCSEVAAVDERITCP